MHKLDFVCVIDGVNVKRQNGRAPKRTVVCAITAQIVP